MDSLRFGYCGFVPGTRTERSFARSEESGAMSDRIADMIDDACRDTQVSKVQVDPERVTMPQSKHYIVQLEFEVWLAPWFGDPGRTCTIETAKRFSSRQQAVNALEAARQYRPFRDAFVDILRAMVI